MESLLSIFENLFSPVLLVGFIYLVFLVPIYLLIKKYKSSYWMMIRLSILIVYSVDGVIFLLTRWTHQIFFINLFFDVFLFNFIFLAVLPFFYKSLIKKEKVKKIVFTYLLFFLSQSLLGGLIAYILVLSIATFSNF